MTYNLLAGTIYGGPFQSDSESVYGGPATEALIAMGAGDLAAARTVVEFGCGPARLAARLLSSVLPPECRYVGVDQSPTMIQYARGGSGDGEFGGGSGCAERSLWRVFIFAA